MARKIRERLKIFSEVYVASHPHAEDFIIERLRALRRFA